jgi:hypothetical protein
MFDNSKAFASILSASFDGHWSEALGEASAAGGGWAGQLLAVTPAGEVLYDLGHRVPAEALAEFELRGGVDQAANPRAAVLRRRHFEVLGDDAVISADARWRNPFYAEIYAPADAPYVCMARLPGPDGSSIVLASLRAASAGHVAADDRLRFGMLLPHFAAAIRLQARLDGHGKSIAIGALDAVRLPAFLLSAAGRVVAATWAAEALAQDSELIRVRRRSIRAVDRSSDARLQAAIRLACRWTLEPTVRTTSVVLRGERTAATAQVAPLPSCWGPSRHGAVAVLTVEYSAAGAHDPCRDDRTGRGDMPAAEPLRRPAVLKLAAH